MGKRSKPLAKKTAENLALALTKHDEVNIQVGTPFLDAKILATLEEVSPDLRERILKMAEKEQEHRHELESQLVRADIDELKSERKAIHRGQSYAFIIALVSLSIGAFLIYVGRPLEGFITSGVTLLGIIVAFIKSGRKSKIISQSNPVLPPQ